MKKKYQSPEVQLHKIVIENSIATGSAKATFTGPNKEDTPEVNPWTINPNFETDNPNVIENW